MRKVVDVEDGSGGWKRRKDVVVVGCRREGGWEDEKDSFMPVGSRQKTVCDRGLRPTWQGSDEVCAVRGWK